LDAAHFGRNDFEQRAFAFQSGFKRFQDTDINVERTERGMVRSDMIHMTMCMLFGVSDRKSRSYRAPSALVGILDPALASPHE
jgi:hypothetical protein